MNALLGQAELGLRETPEQRLQREAFITLLGQRPEKVGRHRVSINVDEKGRDTAQHDKHIWVVDDDGNMIKHVGKDTEKVQVFDQGGAGGGFEQQRNELAELKHAEDRAHELLSVDFPSKVVRDEVTRQWKLVGEITDDMRAQLNKHLYDQIRSKQGRNVLPDPMVVPPIGVISSKSQPQASEVPKKKAY